jgi:hypothetical protein
VQKIKEIYINDEDQEQTWKGTTLVMKEPAPCEHYPPL